jgi:hypothetical protein
VVGRWQHVHARLASLDPIAAVFGLSQEGLTAPIPALIGDLFPRLAVAAIVCFIFAVAGCTG